MHGIKTLRGDHDWLPPSIISALWQTLLQIQGSFLKSDRIIWFKSHIVAPPYLSEYEAIGEMHVFTTLTRIHVCKQARRHRLHMAVCGYVVEMLTTVLVHPLPGYKQTLTVQVRVCVCVCVCVCDVCTWVRMRIFTCMCMCM